MALWNILLACDDVGVSALALCQFGNFIIIISLA